MQPTEVFLTGTSSLLEGHLSLPQLWEVSLQCKILLPFGFVAATRLAHHIAGTLWVCVITCAPLKIKTSGQAGSLLS